MRRVMFFSSFSLWQTGNPCALKCSFYSINFHIDHMGLANIKSHGKKNKTHCPTQRLFRNMLYIVSLILFNCSENKVTSLLKQYVFSQCFLLNNIKTRQHQPCFKHISTISNFILHMNITNDTSTCLLNNKLKLDLFFLGIQLIWSIVFTG